MWTVRPVDWLAREYSVDEGKARVGTVRFRTWSERGGLELDRERFDIEREGVWRWKLHLRRKGRRIATARSAGGFRGGYLVEHGNEEYRLERASAFARSYHLKRGEDDLGSIQPVGFFGRTLAVEFDEEVAPELQLFAVWLVLLAGRRAAAMAAT